MKIKEFIEGLPKDDVNRELFIKSHVVRQYVPLAEKQARANIIVNSSYYDDEGQFRINSVSRHMLTALSFVLAYTDLELSGEGLALSDYDNLAEANIYGIIQSYIPAIELDEFSTVIEMTADDVEKNENAPSAYIKNRINTLSSILKPIVEEIAPLLSERLKPVIEELTNIMSEESN